MKYERILGRIVEAIEKSGRAAERETKSLIISRKRNASGKWKKNQFWSVEQGQGKLTLSYAPKDRPVGGDVRNAGRGSGGVNFQKILQWCIDKKVYYNDKSRKKNTKKRAARQAAYLIARKIRKKGYQTKTPHIYDVGFEKMFNEAQTIINNEVTSIIKEAVESLNKANSKLLG